MKLSNTKKIGAVILIAAALFQSCKKNLDPKNDIQDSSFEKYTKEEGYVPKTTGKTVQAYYRGELVGLLEIENGQYLFEGDIVLERKDINFPGEPRVESTPDKEVWPNKTFYYKIDTSVKADLKTKWATAIKMWEDAGLGLTFLEAGAANKQYVLLLQTTDGGASSNGIGYRKSGQMTIKVDPRSFGAGSVAHEIGHALGLQHEQGRPDRDLFVIADTTDYQYQLKSGSIPVGRFDYQSIMMYGSKTGTLTRIDGTGWKRNRDSLTTTDIMGIRYKYNISTYTTDGIYEIEPKNNIGKNLQLNPDSTITIEDDNDSLNQRWQLTHVSDGYYKLVPQSDVKKALGKNYQVVNARANTDSKLQRWRIVPTYTDGYFRIINQNDVKGSLDVDSNASNVKFLPFSLEESQQWKLKRIP